MLEFNILQNVATSRETTRSAMCSILGKSEVLAIFPVIAVVGNRVNEFSIHLTRTFYGRWITPVCMVSESCRIILGFTVARKFDSR